MEYYSQDGQDRFLDERVFKKKRDGVFVDIGANDGLTFSNTYFLEKNRGWTGICVEPHPAAFEKLKRNRSAVLINACITDAEKTGDYMKIDGYGEMYSGLVEKYDQQHVERIERDLSVYGGSREVVKIDCIRLDTLIAQNGLARIDYCSVDTEGGELDILETADLKQNDINVISVENNYYGRVVKKFMNGLDYKLIGKVGADEFYRRSRKSFWFFGSNKSKSEA